MARQKGNGLLREFTACAEPLETRLLLSYVTTDNPGHSVSFHGDESAEEISFAIREGKVFFSVTGSTVAGNVGWDASFTRYIIFAGGGNDSFTPMPIFLGDVPVPLTYNVIGGPGNDTLFGSSWNDTLGGGGGDDQLYGGGAADQLKGGIGRDELWGDGLTDTIADGDDTLIGGDGDDQYVFEATSIRQTDAVEELADQGFDSLNFADESSSLWADLRGAYPKTGKIAWTAHRQICLSTPGGEANWERIVGGSAADVLVGGGGANTLEGGPGSDFLRGEGGNDVLYGQNGADTLDGGIGDDRLYGDAGPDSLTGGAGQDTLRGGAGSNILSGGIGDDTYLFDGGEVAKVDRVEELTNQGNDTLNFSDQTTTLWVDLRGAYPATGKLAWTAYRRIHVTTPGGEANWEHIIGGSANNTLIGNANANNISGNSSADKISGEGGNDTLWGILGTDSLYGGTGNDHVDGGGESDYISGGDGDDTLMGRAGNDTINADAGHDYVEGGDEADSINGGDGNDTLVGNAGRDTALGGAGDDVFYLRDNEIDAVNGGYGTDAADYDGLKDTTTSVERMFRVAADLRVEETPDGLARLSWRDLSDNETGFKVQRSVDNTNWTTIGLAAVDDIGFIDHTLLSPAVYYYRVCATNESGDSPFSVAAFMNGGSALGVWALDGNGSDTSGRGYEATVTGGVWNAVGAKGGSLSLPAASGNSLQIGDFDWLPTSFSISFWLKPNALIQGHQVISASNGWGAFYFNITSLGGVCVGTDLSSRITTPPGTVTVNEWQHFAFTFTSDSAATGTGRLYRNGNLIGAAKPNMAVPRDWTDLRVRYLDGGAIDEIAIYNYALQ